ncbi:MAG TPA: hypothetical protein VK636_22895, partial [Gemmatimonadaceae bacterium]|nr:hypothetical protein [Gemmatimonadaceae bacterium]
MLDSFLGKVYTTFPMTNGEASPRMRGLMWWGIALAVIIAGFADLARGGETIAPILLTIGYCVLIPLAI